MRGALLSTLYVGSVVSILLVGVKLIDRTLCHHYAEQTGRTAKFEWVEGCRVETPAGWLTREEYAVLDVSGLLNKHKEDRP